MSINTLHKGDDDDDNNNSLRGIVVGLGRNVVGSIPFGEIGILHQLNPSGRPMARPFERKGVPV
jgi:hypothetical protein